MKYFAFISYSSSDLKWGKRLQRKLEGFRLPAALGRKTQGGVNTDELGKNQNSSRPLRPVFFAPTDIQPGVLSEELKARLRESRNLIVICSPASAASKWVGLEIEYFVSLGREDNIYFFIVDGSPDPSAPDTCINPVVERLGLPEKLGVNVNERVFKWARLNRERAYIQLISKLLNVDFDVLWRRERRRWVRRFIFCVIGVCVVVGAFASTVGYLAPADVEFNFKGEGMTNTRLPAPGMTSVRLFFDNETRVDSVESISDRMDFRNIPGRFVGVPVRLKAESEYCLPLDTVIILNRENTLTLRRNPGIFGNVQFKIWDSESEKYVTDAKVSVGGIATVSNSEGEVRIEIPLERQDVKYAVEVILPDGTTAKDTVYMPTNEYSIVRIL